MERYIILKESNKEIIGHLNIDDNKLLKIDLNPKTDIANIPMYFRKSFTNNYLVENDEVFTWIKTRIPPAYRQDISDILKSLNLKRYDEIDIFKAYNGKSVRDDYYIEKEL